MFYLFCVPSEKGSVFFVSLEPGLKGQYYYGFGSLYRLYIFKGYPQHKYNVEIIEYINILRQSTSGNPIALFRNFPNSNTENPTHFENTFRTYFHFSGHFGIIWPNFWGKPSVLTRLRSFEASWRSFMTVFGSFFPENMRFSFYAV